MRGLVAGADGDQVEGGAETQLAVTTRPVVVDAVGLALHPRLEAEVLRRPLLAGPVPAPAGALLNDPSQVSPNEPLRVA